ncbi:hypothetical protein C8Q76DRAFT_795277 [Earliella scabrosa]|nr:hypothetical protein C8Q76DRAFT_795277 [Earliella scabrosa]
MSSPIAITNPRAQSPAQTQTGLYIPVHRRNPSASSAPASFQEREFLSPKAHQTRRSPAPRPRSVSPAFTRYHDMPMSPRTPLTPMTPRLNANIPHASTIPHDHAHARVYALTELLALSSSPSTGLSPAQRAQVETHVPFMTRKPSSKSASPKSSSPKSKPAPADPSSNPSPAVPSPTDPNPSPVESQSQKKADAQRRRRSGRKAPSAKARAVVAAAADVDGRRRRAAYGAGWGWAAAPLSESGSWRAERVAVAA